MTKLYETKESLKTEYKRLKKKRVKALPIWLLIIAIILGWYFYVQDVSASQKGLETQLDKLERTIEQRFQDVEESNEKRDKEQDDKIDNVKQAKAKEKERIALLESSRPKPVQRVGSTVKGNCEQYRTLIAQYAWNVDTMVAICNAESGGNPNAANWTDNHRVCRGSFGLFQISCHQGQIFDPAANVAAAWGKYSASGYNPWTVCKTGKVRCI